MQYPSFPLGGSGLEIVKLGGSLFVKKGNKKIELYSGKEIKEYNFGGLEAIIGEHIIIRVGDKVYNLNTGELYEGGNKKTNSGEDEGVSRFSKKYLR